MTDPRLATIAAQIAAVTPLGNSSGDWMQKMVDARALRRELTEDLTEEEDAVVRELTELYIVKLIEARKGSDTNGR